ncbi:MAG TPA: hypothetical protein VMS22_17070 [Candidatus Eisenbacteria bacterium]|nr:hypothetical protein [Candidatus Eisenbacteria bacterium]
MKLGVLVMAGVLVTAGATVGRAEVNCKFVLKNLSLPGRTVQSVAETMSISEDDVKKCQAEAGSAGGEQKGGEQKPAGEAK